MPVSCLPWRVAVTHPPAALRTPCPSRLRSNGLLDPWSGGGVLHSISEARDVVAIIIPEGGALDCLVFLSLNAQAGPAGPALPGGSLYLLGLLSRHAVL